MKRSRSMALITRGDKILVVKHRFPDRSFYILPGGGVESGEDPEVTVIRELKEECGLDGTIIRPLNVTFKDNGRKEYVYEVSIPDDAEPVMGMDPEIPANEQILVEVAWKRLEELNEHDRAFLWSYGLIRIPLFRQMVLSWPDVISYPGM
jgi:8-oxo-dGTP pyrophosphatase MutT (NUDIX family)